MRRAKVNAAGFDVDPASLHRQLRDDQRAVVAWALRLGRAGLFINTGGGKTFDQLEWARVVSERTGGKVLILAPLVVADQTAAEGNERWGIPVRYVRNQEEADAAPERILTSNYEIMDHFNFPTFAGVACDEVSFLKNSRGKQRHYLNRTMKDVRYRLLATATPAPNEIDELGNYSHVLGDIPWHEMITRYFIRDPSQADALRLKKHAEAAFWEWVASWSICMTRPSDIGFGDAGFDLPRLIVNHETVDIDPVHAWDNGTLFPMQALSATGLWENKRLTLDGRMERAAEVVSRKPNAPHVVWVETNAEADKLRELLPEAVEVRGDEPFDTKRAKLRAFTRGDERLLITKLDIAGFGVNWQHCADTVFASLTFSFERVYQGMRRFWRYGQRNDVTATFITASTESDVLQSISRKEAQFAAMQVKMNAAMKATGLLSDGALFEDYGYHPRLPAIVPQFIHNRFEQPEPAKAVRPNKRRSTARA
jgi:hypothetical protein